VSFVTILASWGISLKDFVTIFSEGRGKHSGILKNGLPSSKFLEDNFIHLKNNLYLPKYFIHPSRLKIRKTFFQELLKSNQTGALIGG
jgi:hypothetical protein